MNLHRRNKSSSFGATNQPINPFQPMRVLLLFIIIHKHYNKTKANQILFFSLFVIQDRIVFK